MFLGRNARVGSKSGHEMKKTPCNGAKKTFNSSLADGWSFSRARWHASAAAAWILPNYHPRAYLKLPAPNPSHPHAPATLFHFSYRERRVVVLGQASFLTIMKTSLVLAGWFVGGNLPALGALPLTESTFTEIVHEANVISATNKAGIPARTQEVFKVPDLVRTGLDSRVELTAKDHTITRVGANTTFTFAASGRDIELKQGGVLFHAPAGVGGGTIKYRGSAAAVLGTTVLAEVLPDGGFKVVDLEGRVKVTLQNGQLVTLMPGQMVIVAANGNAMGAVRNFKLGQLAPILLGVVGFSRPLASAPLIEAAILQQDQRIAAGELTELVSLPVASLGLDITARTTTGLVPQTGNRSQQKGPLSGTDPTDRAAPAAPAAANGFNHWANPLDFPGATLVSPLESGPGGLLLKFAAASDTVPPVISPPAITELSPGGSGVP